MEGHSKEYSLELTIDFSTIKDKVLGESCKQDGRNNLHRPNGTDLGGLDKPNDVSSMKSLSAAKDTSVFLSQTPRDYLHNGDLQNQMVFSSEALSEGK